MTKRILSALLPLFLFFSLSAPAFADNYAVRDANGSTLNFAAKNVGGIYYPYHLCMSLFGGTPTACAMDASGNIGVNVKNTPTVALTTGSSTIGNVGINGGVNSIGTVGLNAGVASIGSVGLNAGTNIAGKFGIDQTTPGTTNGVQVNSSALPTGAATNATVGETHATFGSDATKGEAVQGCTGCKSVAVNPIQQVTTTAVNIASAGAGATILASNASRKGCFIQMLTAGGPFAIQIGGVSYMMSQNQVFDCTHGNLVITDAITNVTNSVAYSVFSQ